MKYKYLFIIALVIIVIIAGKDIYAYQQSNIPAEALAQDDVAVCGTGEGCSISDKRVKGFETGNQIPNITLENFDGEQTNLYDLINGKEKFVLSFAVDWCSDCERQDDKMAKYYEDMPENFGFAAVLVDFDSYSGEYTTDKDQAMQYALEKNYPFPVFWDTDNKINSQFGGIKATPTNFLLDENGVIKAKTEEIDADTLFLLNKEELYDKSLFTKEEEE